MEIASSGAGLMAGLGPVMLSVWANYVFGEMSDVEWR